MFKVRIIAISLAITLVATILVQRQMVQKARTERIRLQFINGQSGEQLTATEVIAARERLQNETRELPKLRNEVRQLRAQTNALQMLRAEHARLLAEFANITNAPPRPPPTPEQGFVSNETWANAGLGSPEACIQTLFWALRHQNFDVLAACLDPEGARRFITQAGEWSPDGLQELLPLGKAGAYRIVQIEPQAEDRVIAHVQGAVEGATMPLSLVRSGSDWKLE